MPTNLAQSLKRVYTGPIDADSIWPSVEALNAAIAQAKAFAGTYANPFHVGQQVVVATPSGNTVYTLVGEELTLAEVGGGSGTPNLDFTQQNAMRFGGPSGAAQELVSTLDGRAILTSTLTEQQSILGITSGRGNLIMGNLLDEGDDIIFGAVNA